MLYAIDRSHVLAISDYLENGLSDNPTEMSDNPYPPDFRDTISYTIYVGFLKSYTISLIQTNSERIGQDIIRSVFTYHEEHNMSNVPINKKKSTNLILFHSYIRTTVAASISSGPSAISGTEIFVKLGKALAVCSLGKKNHV